MTVSTPDLINTPDVRFANLLDEDPLGQAYWKYWFGAGRYGKLRKHFSALGESGALATELSARVDKQVPVLQTHDARGLRIDRVVEHPDYRKLEKLSYGRGIVGIKYQTEFLASHRAYRHLTVMALG